MLAAKPHPDGLELEIRGPVTHTEVSRLSVLSEREIGSPPPPVVIINMEGVEMIDSMGLGWLIQMWRTLSESQSRMVLCNLQAQVFSAMAMAQVDRLIPISASVDEALEMSA